jgi:hypothetical protein
MRRIDMLRVLIASSLLTACASGFNERHYFRATNRRTGETVNYFRLTVRGWDGLTASRFVAGLYDERAVDFFFNEIRTGETLQPLLSTSARASKDVEVRPLEAGDDGGIFVLILSTNAKSVADTLGEFAENQVVADAMTNLINRDAIRENREFLVLRRTAERRGEALREHLDSLFGELGKATTKSQADTIGLQIVRTIGAASDPPIYLEGFNTVEEWAKTQLALIPREGR